MDISYSTSPNEDYISVDKLFASFQDFQDSLKKYEQAKKQKYWIRNSRSLDAAKKLGIPRICNETLKYYSIRFCCIHGGLKFKSRGTGQRSSKTYKKDCLAFIRLRASKDGQYLQVVDMSESHINHPNSEILFNHLPQVKRLSTDKEITKRNYIRLNFNKEANENITTVKLNKTTLNGLANMETNTVECNDLESCVNMLKDTCGADVHVLPEGKCLKALFFSTKEMRQSLSAWPQFVALDGPYKLLNIDLIVYVFLVEDGGGNIEIAGVGLLASKDKDSVYWLVNTFKNIDTNTDSIQCLITDKDVTDVSREVFPGVATYISSFQVWREFSRKVSGPKFNISQEERTISLELLTKLIYASSNEEYDRLYDLFCTQVPSGIVIYFNKNWHTIKNQWTICNMKYGNLDNQRNNRLESINDKLRQVVSKTSSLLSFIKSFFIWLNSFHNERNKRLSREILKADIPTFKFGSVEDQYTKLLTKYACDFTTKNLSNARHVIVLEQQKDNIFEARSRYNKTVVTVSETNCSCANFSSMLLPCKHIFALKYFLNKSSYCPDLCHKRWTKEYYFLKQELPNTMIQSNDSHLPSEVLTLSQKRSKATYLCNKIFSDLIQSTTDQFQYRYEILQKIESFWKDGQEIVVQPIHSDETNSNIAETTCEVNENGMENDSETTGTSHSSVISIEIETNPEKATFLKADKICMDQQIDKNKDNTSEPENINSHKYQQSDIERPSKLKKRDMTSDMNTAVIGSKKTKVRKIPLDFGKKSYMVQVKYILENLVQPEKIPEILVKSHCISESDFKENIGQPSMSDEVDLDMLQEYFTDSALETVKEIKKNYEWNCTSCKESLGNYPNIMCDGCLFWFHFPCAGLIRQPKTRTWFCRYCC